MAITYPLERPLQVSVLVITFIFSICAVITVFLRVLGRFKLGRWLDMSDYAMVGALVSSPFQPGTRGRNLGHTT